MGINLPDLKYESRLAVACYLCSTESYPSLDYLLKTYSDFPENSVVESLERKIERVKEKFPDFRIENVFPWHNLLSPQIERSSWFNSFLKKPKVWIRIRKKYSDIVFEELKNKNIYFLTHDDQVVSFSPDVSLEKTDSYQKGYFEIQDKSSQATKDFFHPGKGEMWWDACAGSGGKSLLLIDEAPDMKIFATDIREKVLLNFTDRLKKSRHKLFDSELADLTKPIKNTDARFDGIIADVPCSGSGTWSRAPEWLSRKAEPRVTDYYVPLQRTIVSNILPALKVGFPLVYITCSVFLQENEENVTYFLEHLPLKLEKCAYIEGYQSGSDTLFAARFIKTF
jgi:16S rRNA (cytosine967-C5)-methyltransferase